MYKLMKVVLAILPFVAAGWAQTASELDNKYAHHKVYEVQPGVQMSTSFASDGLVCEMLIEPSHFSNAGVDMREIDKDDVVSLIDKLVPESERGEEDKADPANGMSMATGQVGEEMHSYLNVRVHIITSHGNSVAYIHWRHRQCQSLLKK